MDEPAQQDQPVSAPPAPPPSNPPGVGMPPPESPPQAPLEYEETPEIVAQPPEAQQPATPEPAPQPQPAEKRSGSCLKIVGVIILIIILFSTGIWLSSFIRQFLPTGATTGTPVTTQTTPIPSVTANPYATWKSYDVISGVTKLPVTGLTFKLPPEVLTPVCDGAACTSQGTYLPGGTRLTIAARGAGQNLRDFRGTVITDANGVPMPTKQLILGTITATEYESSGSGRTISGYAFTQIRGVMIPLTDTVSVEVNHFTPSGIAVNFAADDTLFDSIVNTFTYTGATPSAAVTPTPLVTSTASATSSGY